MNIYRASDYAGLKAGSREFYYGYEQTVCNNHAAEDCQNCEWAFVAKENGVEAMRIASSTLCSDPFDVAENLLAGIGLFLELREAEGR